MSRIILGIDPGSRVTGYGIIQVDDKRIRYVDSGCIRTESENMYERLAVIFENIKTLVEQYRPTEAAMEEVFVNANVQSALKLGQARGSAVAAIATSRIPIEGYSPRQIKLAVVGYGNADKAQVQHMVKTLLALDKTPPSDAADALAAALCHSQTHASLERLNQAR
ncbi:MAG: crossover junction endodeoxyribonuclease RuvC [Gammaproteobacteria bacterium CG11_big_fil_rev_8_21_14_0_20_46_22]|nr:MAG: crossover junction endodeoxyribonuclease RuvC [Gammaproteobacteria bacterium CG12_big_fil_rev_8_21_14_0_65_46_12]PIR11443.1 MAG: crossover junction endodeoxyribonuclease RuvC [Gammaproteobacteria bacterium CG11_big_fil_rev_8_21_14_0_20_46_22]